MATEVSIDFSGLENMLPDARSKFSIEMKRTIVDAIVKVITSGKSPVKGFGQYENYSQKYGIKKGVGEIPANLLDTGDMLNDMIAVQKNNGEIEIKFRSSLQNAKADGHNTGANSLPVRRLFPTENGEEFIDELQEEIFEAVERAVAKAILKANS